MPCRHDQPPMHYTSDAAMDAAIARILDANLNRAAEALRVMEEHARFGLDDAGLSESLKALRHRLADLRRRLPHDALLSARDIAADVGRTLSAEGERRRADAEDVTRAAARRAAEALRCLEEYAKTLDAELAARFEEIRYETYAVEQRLLCGAARRRALRDARLHVLLTESLCRRPWLETARAALSAGAGVLQLREKSLPDRELLARARQLRDATRAAQALLIVNDRPDIARLADADGVHVGQHDLPVAEARRIVGRDRLVGVSTHSIEQVHAALATGPDYVAAGPMFESSTKRGAAPAGPELLAAAARLVRADPATADTPLVAIGGISRENVERVVAAGGRCVAVCAGVIGADDPAGATRALLEHCVARSSGPQSELP